MILILALLISHFWMATFLVLHLMVFTFLHLFGLLEYLVIWLTSMVVTNIWLLNFSNRGIGIINLGKLFVSFIVDTTNWSLNMIPDEKYLCYKAYRNLNFMLT